MRLVLMLFAAFAMLQAQAQIGAKARQINQLTGVWQNSQFGYQMTLILNEDGTGEFDGESIRYTTQNSQLVVTQAGQQTGYVYTLNDHTLTLSGGDIDGSKAFTRSGAQEAAPPNTSPPAANSTTPTATGSELLGAWSGYGETIEFRPNGQCVYLGQTIPYTVSQGHVILTIQQSQVMMAYQVQGSQLTLTVNGKALSYTKGNGSATGTAAAPNTGKGAVAQELVGKWCYVNVTSTNSGGTSSDECITLHANGTFEYYSERSMSTNTNSFWAGTSSQNADQGTWWVQGDRIFYNSQKQGQGSYQLRKVNHPKNGDPMIVLDGTAYVTQYQKAPW